MSFLGCRGKSLKYYVYRAQALGLPGVGDLNMVGEMGGGRHLICAGCLRFGVFDTTEHSKSV